MTLATVVLAITAAGCTFCYQPSTFERECEKFGGHVHTFQRYQACVFNEAIVEFVEEDSGIDLPPELEAECLAVGRSCASP